VPAPSRDTAEFILSQRLAPGNQTARRPIVYWHLEGAGQKQQKIKSTGGTHADPMAWAYSAGDAAARREPQAAPR
jgi:hypothetical protein